MVKEINNKGRKLYVCSCCGSAYDNKDLAKKCETWCKTHDGHCNIKIMERAVSKG